MRSMRNGQVEDYERANATFLDRKETAKRLALARGEVSRSWKDSEWLR